MPQKNIAEVIVSNPLRSLDRPFHYLIPNKINNKVKVGVRVQVPFGKGNRKIEGYVIGLVDKSDMEELKSIHKVIDESALFDEKMLDIVKWMRKRYICTYYEALKAVLPPGIGIKYKEWIIVDDKIDYNTIENKIKNAPIQKKILKILKENDGSIETAKLITMIKSKSVRNSIQSLINKGIVKSVDKAASSISRKTVRIVFSAVSSEEIQSYIQKMQKKAPAQARVLKLLIENESISVNELVSLASTSVGTLNSLYNKGLINIKEHVVLRNSYDAGRFESTKPFTPTPQQENAINFIMSKFNGGAPCTILLKGVTGSGKTEVFLQIINKIISVGKQAIVLVPEIALTPQMVERFIGRFGSRVAVLHSGLSIGERYDQWKKIKDSKVDVVVGARSAIFAPFNNLGIIILDEEHEYSYKSEISPKYHAREVAERRSKNENALVILSSATPSVDSYYKAEKRIYSIVQMKDRYNKAPLPKVSVVDMRNELVSGNRSIFSNRLKDEIKNNLINKQQTILFLNRRGYSTFVSCRNCGYVLICPHCNISLTYHKKNNSLVCHYCGFKMNNVNVCPKCKSKYIRYFGIGTQRVEKEIKTLFPDASAIRMDIDTTSGKLSHEKILNKFKNENIDILIGTQMVSKGLDFHNVTLVGVLAADMSLNIDDYRSQERTFQLLTQVCGRAGRGDVEGRAIIQTYQPDNFTVELAKKHDYLGFYTNEIQLRKQLCYPPFCKIISIVVSGENERNVIKRVNDVEYSFKQMLFAARCSEKYWDILGPSVSPISKIKNKYRWRILIKWTGGSIILKILRKLSYNHYNDRDNLGLSLIIDIDPVNMF